MRQRLLMVWYTVLTLLLLEVVAYGITGYVADGYRDLIWKQFNQDAHTLHDADKKVPYAEIINRYARDAGINPQVVVGVIQAESSFQPRAVSAAGAYGLMQIMPDTWRQVNTECKVCTLRHKGECSSECYYNTDLNIHIGTAYLGQLLKKYQGNMILALAAYNAGPGAVERYGGMPPYNETINYTESIVTHWYHSENRSIPYDPSMTKQWHTAHTAIGWWLVFTGIAMVWVVWRLKRYHFSWRWR